MDPIPEDDLQVPDRTTDLCQPGDRSQLEAEAPVARGSPSVPRERSKRASKPATAFSFESKKEVVNPRAKPKVGKNQRTGLWPTRCTSSSSAARRLEQHVHARHHLSGISYKNYHWLVIIDESERPREAKRMPECQRGQRGQEKWVDGEQPVYVIHQICSTSAPLRLLAAVEVHCGAMGRAEGQIPLGHRTDSQRGVECSGRPCLCSPHVRITTHLDTPSRWCRPGRGHCT